MLSSVLAWGLQFLGGGVLDKLLTYMEKKSDNETERARIKAVQDQHAQDVQASVVTAGMAHTVFWVAWGMAAIPMCAWFGYGMINTMFTSLPHIAEIPPGLLSWAQIVWGNIFYSGAGVLGVATLAKAITSR